MEIIDDDALADAKAKVSNGRVELGLVGGGAAARPLAGMDESELDP